MSSDNAAFDLPAHVDGLRELSNPEGLVDDLSRLARLHVGLNEAVPGAENATELVQVAVALLERAIVDGAFNPQVGLEHLGEVLDLLEMEPTARDADRITELIQTLQQVANGEEEPVSAPEPVECELDDPEAGAFETPEADVASIEAPAPDSEASQSVTEASEPAADDPIAPAIAQVAQAFEGTVSAADLPRLGIAHTAFESLEQVALAAELPGLATLARDMADSIELVILDSCPSPQRVLDFAAQIGSGIEDPADDAALAAMSAELLAMRDSDDGLNEAAEPTASEADAPAIDEADGAAEPDLQAAGGASEEIEAYVAEPLMIDLSDRENLEGFVSEAHDHLESIESVLLEIEEAPDDLQRIDDLFRPFHTIKGIAGFLNLRDINCLTHEAETLLDLARKRIRALNSVSINLMFESLDVLKQQISALGEYLADPQGEVVPQPECAELIGRLRHAAVGNAVPGAAPAVEASRDADGAEEPGGARGGAPPASRPAGEEGGETRAADLRIKVDTAKLDSLVDAIGELVIAQAMVNQNRASDGDDDLRRQVAQVSKIVRDVQEAVMAMRMVPLGQMFTRMKRVVRDVGIKSGKQVTLQISGEETELDKNVVQQVTDPLVHMVRNAVDHGIEPPEGREAAGKPAGGTIHLGAYYEGDQVVIEIRDDGRGLNPQKLITKGIERGLITSHDVLTDEQAFALIMEPGFSTAEAVTDISGRGVGMDVVRRNIEALRGKLEILSTPGQGSTFRIKLPLTLAIIDGMLVRLGAERVVIPTIMIEQSLRPTAEQLNTVHHRGVMLKVRDQLCPIVQLGPLFGFCDAIDPLRSLVVVVHSGNKRFGLVVDELVGQQQVVIKSLGEECKSVRGISGAAILGDGRVGLILEPRGIAQVHESSAGVSTGLTRFEPDPRPESQAEARGFEPDERDCLAVTNGMDADPDRAVDSDTGSQDAAKELAHANGKR